MSKFHDEFFKSGSPKHDRLMIKTLSSDGIVRICEAADIDKTAYDDREKQLDLHRHFTICERSDKTITIYSGWREYGNSDIPEIDHRNKCSKYQCPTIDACTKTIRKLDVNLTLANCSVDRVYETEVIARSGNFIIGYADAIIRSTYRGDLCADLGYNSPHVLGKFELNADVLVEAKPELNSIGDVLRQLKTYRSLLVRRRRDSTTIPINMVITTYTSLDQDSLEYLAHEGVKVVTFGA